MTTWGKTADGTAVPIYTLTSAQIEVRVTAYGAHLVSVEAPDRDGKKADVVLGWDSLDGYLQQPNSYLGAVVGRYGNRIALGKFTIDGKTYQIPVNNGANALHGGPKGFDRYVWDSHEVSDGVEFTHVSPDGDMGFPGTLTAKVKYTLKGDTLRIDYSATTDKPTVLNLTNHSYFNLHGDDKGTNLDLKVELNADRYTPVDAGLIPTGELRAVTGTPFDFTKATAIGARIGQGDRQLQYGKGYDHNWVLNKGNAAQGASLTKAAEVYEPKSGRVMEVFTTELGVQFYTGNFLDGTVHGKGGKVYPLRGALCLETQHFPDSPNHPAFPTTEVKPGATYRSTTVYRFSAR